MDERIFILHSCFSVLMIYLVGGLNEKWNTGLQFSRYKYPLTRALTKMMSFFLLERRYKNSIERICWCVGGVFLVAT